MQKKRANKAKTIEQLADDTITITEPLSNFPVDCLKGGDTGPLQARCNKSEEPSNMPQEEGTTNVQEKRKSVKSVDALASKVFLTTICSFFCLKLQPLWLTEQSLSSPVG